VKVMKFKNTFLVLAAIILTAFSTSSISAGGQYRDTNRLTGTYWLNESRSDNPYTVAVRVSNNLPPGQQARFRNAVMKRLEAPELLIFEVRGRVITLASANSPLVTFEADGRANTEWSRNGRSQRTTTTLKGNKLTVITTGDRTIDYQVVFESIDGGRRLRVTRSIFDEDLRNPVVAKSVYDRSLDTPQWNSRYGRTPSAANNDRRNGYIPGGTTLSATLNNNLNTRLARDGDRFTLTVHSPAQFNGAAIEGHVVEVNRSGKVKGRAEMALEFDRIRLRDGRTGNFDGYIESVRTRNGEIVNVDNEGRIQADTSQTERTVTRTGIGAAIGAMIGAIADGGKGAAIGAAVGAGAGAGSVFVQGRDDLDLRGGTEFRLRSTNT
jgi:hypothetical protein